MTPDQQFTIAMTTLILTSLATLVGTVLTFLVTKETRKSVAQVTDQVEVVRQDVNSKMQNALEERKTSGIAEGRLIARIEEDERDEARKSEAQTVTLPVAPTDAVLKVESIETEEIVDKSKRKEGE